MTLKTPLALVVLVSFGYQGYKTRRPVWTRRSWLRFGLLLGGAIILTATCFAMGWGVDHGVYEGMTKLQHRAYFYTLMTLMIIGPTTTFGLLWWFANGRPDRQLG